ncbi:trypsin-like serine protease [Methylobacterium currus]|uniref:trypsin-like serine protease n=1 Tax=Methylobacterium currus TaxID=2051553 RepID=UPI001E467648|nr:trypsin-like serine protease [Methylobacterium currus]UHC17169.1 trypsin-like serine protease [Methylobacterium currus]
MPDGQSQKYPINDLAVFKIDYKISNADLSNFAVFANNDNINKQLKNKSVTQYGQTSTSSGNFEETSVDGQFRASVATDGGDSGGPAACQIGKQEFVAGITSLGSSTSTCFSYLKPVEFYNLMSFATRGDDNVFKSLPPDLIYDSSKGKQKYFRGTKRNAEFLINDSDSTILLGQGSDLVNTGSGTNNLIIAQDAIGFSGTGFTYVVSQGLRHDRRRVEQ